MQIRQWELMSMRNMSLSREAYSYLSLKERTIYVVRDHISDWFQALSDEDRFKEMKLKNANRNAPR